MSAGPFAAFNRGDLDAALKLMHPDVEWQTHDAFPDAGTYRGREGVREFWQTWRDTFRGFRLHLEDCLPVGEHYVLATFRLSEPGAREGGDAAGLTTRRPSKRKRNFPWAPGSWSLA